MLIYTDNSLIDPWSVAQLILSENKKCKPLIALQPLYLSPLAAARKISSLAFLYSRSVALNLVTGGFVNDLEQLGDTLTHDQRYQRLYEYALIMFALLRGEKVTFSGQYYQVKNLVLSPSLPADLMPEFYISGQSSACIRMAKDLNITRFSYTKPPEVLALENEVDGGTLLGLRIGIIARQTQADAWDLAYQRFPIDRRGQMAHKLARVLSDSVWHQQLSKFAEQLAETEQNPYWLRPMKNYKTFCPYLVGSYQQVAAYLKHYTELGYSSLILDVPHGRDDLYHAMQAIEMSQI